MHQVCLRAQRVRLGWTAAAALVVATLLAATDANAAPSAPFDAAAVFGARPGIEHAALSPDGKSVAYVQPAGGQGAVLMVLPLTPDAKPRAVLSADGNPARLAGCEWIANSRLACTLYGMLRVPKLLPFTRLVAVDATGGGLKMLSDRPSAFTRGFALGGGEIIDWLPDAEGELLMARYTLPDDHVGSRLGTAERGLRVDRLNTRTLQATTVEATNPRARDFLTDGFGNVRILRTQDMEGASGYMARTSRYFFRRKGSREWEPLGTWDVAARQGFYPVAVDAATDVAYGFRKLDGRLAVVSVALDGTGKETLVHADAAVDVDDVVQLGRRQRVVGVSFAGDYRKVIYTDTKVAAMMKGLARALPDHPLLTLADASVDERRFLVMGGSDNDPGVYYLLDREARQLEPLLVVRPPLEGVTLATVKPVRYPAADGTQVPGYLTLPPGREDAKGLPAIVLPHGGPSARDEWGFDWLSQFYAARGYAVLQPNFRGSTGFGEAWLRQNGFRSWRVAIGDVLDAGRWLVSSGIADPTKLAVVGWSYGGYAALQSAATEADVFKAVVAIAPVTDLAVLKRQSNDFSNDTLVDAFIGDGPHLQEGSPALQAAAIRAPVLLFHGTEDFNVFLEQSQRMEKALRNAGKPVSMVTFEGLDHYLEDTTARTRLLRESDQFLRKAMGLPPG